MSDFSSYLPFAVVFGGLVAFFYLKAKNGQRAEKYYSELKEQTEMAKETLGLMRRQVAALEAIAKKP